MSTAKRFTDALRASAYLRRALTNIAELTQKEVAAGMDAAADDMILTMKAICPVEHDARHGRTPGTLRESIRREDGTTKDGRPSVRVVAGNKKAFYARWVEFGTAEHAPGSYRDAKGKKRNAGTRGHASTRAHPFFWPVYRAKKATVKKAVRAAIKQAVKDALR